MPETVSEFTVLLASPSDVLADRDAVEEAIEELRRLRAADSITIRVLRWERDAAPGVGNRDAQEVIDRQFFPKYDIVVGLIGRRLGSPTATALSGTVHEIEHGLSHPRPELGNLHVQVYFRGTPINPLEIDLVELQRVQEFKKSLAGRHVLSKEYLSIEDLQQQIRANISRAIEVYRSNRKEKHQSGGTQTHDEEADADLGLLDYHDLHQARMMEANASIERLNHATETMAAAISIRATELGKLRNSSDRAKVRTEVQRAASLFDETAAKYEATLEDLRRANKGAIAALRATLTIVDEDQFAFEKQQALELAQTHEATIAAIVGAREGLGIFSRALAALPRLTREFNLSKRRLLSALSAIDALLDSNWSERREIQEQLQNLIGKRFAANPSGLLVG